MPAKVWLATSSGKRNRGPAEGGGVTGMSFQRANSLDDPASIVPSVHGSEVARPNSKESVMKHTSTLVALIFYCPAVRAAALEPTNPTRPLTPGRMTTIGSPSPIARGAPAASPHSTRTTSRAPTSLRQQMAPGSRRTACRRIPAPTTTPMTRITWLSMTVAAPTVGTRTLSA